MMLMPVFVLLSVTSAAAPPPTTHPFTVHDLLAMDRLKEPQVSPNGRLVAFVRSRTDLDANRRRADLWLVGTDGGGLRRLTAHESGSDSSPRWSRDGRFVYFLSGRSEVAQVWRVAIDGGEAEAVTALPLDVNAFVLSRDDAMLAVSVDVFVDCPTLACTKDRLLARGKDKASGRLYDALFVRHWDTWGDGRRAHLFVLPRQGNGTAVDVMRGMDADSPSKPFGGGEEVAFASDNKRLVFTARDAGRQEAWSTNFDLFEVELDVAGKGKPKNLTAANKAWDTQPVFSPDGKTLAYLAMATPGYEADRFRVMLRAWPSGPERVLTEKWDRSPSAISWSADGKTLLAEAEDTGQGALFAIDVQSGDVKTLRSEGLDKSAAFAGDSLVYSHEDFRAPAELYAARLDGSEPKALTHLNASVLAVAETGEVEHFSFKGWHNETVWGYAIKPAGFVPGKKYPLALLIHGGPQNSFGNDFHYRWNPQTYAGAGFAALIIDFHGSTGYGQAFTDSIQGDWGGKPLEDLQAGLAAALGRYAWIDGTRVCALGASFGAYMVNWIAGNWSERFRCLVAHDGNLDERAAYFDTEELWFPEHDHMGTPWQNAASYEKHNPINFVQNWRTPMLIVHGGKDYRVVDTQGLMTFTAAQRMGVPSRLLYFPDENHWVLKPANSILWHETVLAWLKRWTASGAGR